MRRALCYLLSIGLRPPSMTRVPAYEACPLPWNQYGQTGTSMLTLYLKQTNIIKHTVHLRQERAETPRVTEASPNGPGSLHARSRRSPGILLRTSHQRDPQHPCATDGRATNAIRNTPVEGTAPENYGDPTERPAFSGHTTGRVRPLDAAPRLRKDRRRFHLHSGSPTRSVSLRPGSPSALVRANKSTGRQGRVSTDRNPSGRLRTALFPEFERRRSPERSSLTRG